MRTVSMESSYPCYCNYYMLLGLLLLLLLFLVETEGAFHHHHHPKQVSKSRYSLHRTNIPITYHQQQQSSNSVIMKVSLDEQNNNEQQQQHAIEVSKPSTNIIESIISIIGSTTSIVVSGIFFIVLAYKRDALMVSFFIGSIMNGILSKILKKLINQTRPPELDDNMKITLKPSDGGMPSSHAMSLGFIGTFTTLLLPQITIPLIIYVLISLFYRVQVKLHTSEQIIVGSIVGSLNGYIWYQLCGLGSSTNNGLLSLVGITTNIQELVTQYFLNEHGLLPYPLLIIPVLVGAATVGSVERRIAILLQKRSKKKEKVT